MMRIRTIIILCFLCFAVGSGLTWGLTNHPVAKNTDSSSKGEQMRAGGYRFINPLLDCEEGDVFLNQKEFGTLKGNLQDIIEKEKSAGIVHDVSLYYRDLNNGPTFGIDSDVKFAPASLLKLPVLMAYYKKAENEPSVLSRSLTYNADSIELPQVFSHQELEKGKSYTTEDLIELMIQESNNGALNVLLENIDSNLISKVLTDLDVTVPNDSTDPDFLSVKDYASLFRMLYNASYLTRYYSEKALSVLQGSEFKKGLVAGVPSDVVVAHKYGERELQTGFKQLHDCGIVYYHNNPYLLCVMTRGNDIEKQAVIIEEISREVFREVDKRQQSRP